MHAVLRRPALHSSRFRKTVSLDFAIAICCLEIERRTGAPHISIQYNACIVAKAAFRIAHQQKFMMDIIFIRELRLPAWIGLYKYEKAAMQTIELDLEFALPGESVFMTRKVRDTIDYGVVCERIEELLQAERFGLVESLAERIAQVLLDEFQSPHVVVSVTKLGVLKNAKRVGVRLERSRN